VPFGLIYKANYTHAAIDASGRDGIINVINGDTFNAISVRVQNVGETGANRGAAKRR
jgi:hypothetical protein